MKKPNHKLQFIRVAAKDSSGNKQGYHKQEAVQQQSFEVYVLEARCPPRRSTEASKPHAISQDYSGYKPSYLLVFSII